MTKIIWVRKEPEPAGESVAATASPVTAFETVVFAKSFHQFARKRAQHELFGNMLGDEPPEAIRVAKAKLADLDARLAKQSERLWSEMEKRRLDAWSAVLDKIDRWRQSQEAKR